MRILKGLPRPPAIPTAGSAPGLVEASVEECLATVEQLHTELAHELSRRRQLEREVGSMRAALADARTELVGTQAGEHEARQLALHDGLTGLPNRSYFLQQLDWALANVEKRRPAVAILYLDLDDFKPINDEHGHQTGDEVLKIIASRLSRAVRADDMMSRLGGDEFACLPAAFLNWEQLGHLARKLIEVVAAPLAIGSLTLTVHPSVGIATYPTDGTTAGDLLRSADEAMYRAKRAHAGYFFADRRPAQVEPAGITRPASP